MSKEKKYNCIVIDDEYLARKLLEEYISKVPQLELMQTFDNPVDAMGLVAQGKVEIIFTDIEMADISGIDFIKNMDIPSRPMIIFVTAYSQYAVQGFEVDAIEYLLKPVTFPRFLKAVNKAVSLLNIRQKLRDNTLVAPLSQERDYIIIRTEGKIIKLYHDEIYFIEGALEYVSFYTLEKKELALFSLKKLEEELPSDKFLRIHKSYIVAVDKIREINGLQVKVGKWDIKVSKPMKPKLLEMFSGR